MDLINTLHLKGVILGCTITNLVHPIHNYINSYQNIGYNGHTDAATYMSCIFFKLFFKLFHLVINYSTHSTYKLFTI